MANKAAHIRAITSSTKNNTTIVAYNRVSKLGKPWSNWIWVTRSHLL